VKKRPRAAVVVVGTELLEEGRIDTNGPHMAGALADEGYEPVLRLVVGDDRRAIASAMRIAAEQADLVLVSGGLGPTFDDLTREAAAEAFGLTLRRRPALEKELRDRYDARGLRPPKAIFCMADVLEGAEILANSVGSAPGQFLRGSPVVALLPGVPSEMEAMIRDQVRPRLRRGGGAAGRLRRVFGIAGMYESQVEAVIGDHLAAAEGVDATILASPGEITLVLRAEPDHQVSLDAVAGEVRSALGQSIFTEGDEPLEACVGGLLRRQGLSLATAESCTGGMLGGQITGIPGSSEYYLGGVVTYADRIKSDLLGVPAESLLEAGAVSEEVARAMAEGVRARLGSDLGLAVTGIAGPGGGTAEKPVGLVCLGMAAPWGTISRRLRLGGLRTVIREISSRAALDLLRREVLRQTGASS
jgi:nicotinamide-nucleotide amidase